MAAAVAAPPKDAAPEKAQPAAQQQQQQQDVWEEDTFEEFEGEGVVRRGMGSARASVAAHARGAGDSPQRAMRHREQRPLCAEACSARSAPGAPS